MKLVPCVPEMFSYQFYAGKGSQMLMMFTMVACVLEMFVKFMLEKPSKCSGQWLRMCLKCLSILRRKKTSKMFMMVAFVPEMLINFTKEKAPKMFMMFTMVVACVLEMFTVSPTV